MIGNRNLVEGMLGIERNTYAWRIDTWQTVEGTPMGEGIVEGPSQAPEELLQLAREGKGKRFRMLDGDGYTYCKGRLVVREGLEDVDLGYDPEFGPLDDYGTGGLGCTEIQYWEKDESGRYSWHTL